MHAHHNLDIYIYISCIQTINQNTKQITHQTQNDTEKQINRCRSRGGVTKTNNTETEQLVFINVVGLVFVTNNIWIWIFFYSSHSGKKYILQSKLQIIHIIEEKSFSIYLHSTTMILEDSNSWKKFINSSYSIKLLTWTFDIL